jgi:hypothetical protein
MSLMEHARDLVKGLVVPGPEVGDHDTTPERETTRLLADEVLAGEPSEEAIEQARLEWETQPSHQ